MGQRDHKRTERRADQRFTQRVTSRIWLEEPAEDNPYIAVACRCHGYDLLDLMRKRSFTDVLYLLFRGELPSPAQSKLLEQLMIGLINPGPRHPATRAAMNAGIGKTDATHLLPIALGVLSGEHLGAGEIEPAMRFLRASLRRDPSAVSNELLQQAPLNTDGDLHLGPGFGSRFGSVDPVAAQMADLLVAHEGSGATLQWGQQFTQHLSERGYGWLNTGLAAAVFCDLGFLPRAGAGLYQLLCAPGLLAHGVEMSNKPLTAMPFLDDAHYVIETKSR